MRRTEAEFSFLNAWFALDLRDKNQDHRRG